MNITNPGAEEAVEDFGLINKIDIGPPRRTRNLPLYICQVWGGSCLYANALFCSKYGSYAFWCGFL